MSYDDILASLAYMSPILEAISVCTGVCIFVMGVFRLKRYGEMRTFMSNQATIWGPLLMMISGVLLVALPTFIATSLNAVSGSGVPMAYQEVGSPFDPLVKSVIIFVRIIGVCSFIRGLVLLSRTGLEQSQPGSGTKSLLHILGGILCVNVMGFIGLIKTSFGF